MLKLIYHNEKNVVVYLQIQNDKTFSKTLKTFYLLNADIDISNMISDFQITILMLQLWNLINQTKTKTVTEADLYPYIGSIMDHENHILL